MDLDAVHDGALDTYLADFPGLYVDRIGAEHYLRGVR